LLDPDGRGFADDVAASATDPIVPIATANPHLPTC
jgi:hypothetical protein